MSRPISRTAGIRAAAKRNDGLAEPMLVELLRDLFSIEARQVTINRDQYSLNSLNGFFTAGGDPFFFKFHQEEGEEAMRGEYYRADILARAGLPVDQPVLISTLIGEQLLVYRRRSDPRFSDVLRRLDLDDDVAARARAVAAERELSRKVMGVYAASLHPITPEQSQSEPIHRLFFERLVDISSGAFPGGRLASFYVGRKFAFPAIELDWPQLAAAHWRINGIEYRHSVAELFREAFDLLNPARLADAGGVVAHGDAHNANVWYTEGAGVPALSLFDPAFAGEHVPSLLAEIKTTFHNVLAHPLWLYDPDEFAQRYAVSADYADGVVSVTTDWDLSPVRSDLLEAKAEELWRPLLALLKARGLLPAHWRRVVRSALFLCPTLVMNLRSGAATHNPASSLLGFANAVRAGSEPVRGTDRISRFLDGIEPK